MIPRNIVSAICGLVGAVLILAAVSPLVVHDIQYAECVASYAENPTPVNRIAYLEHSMRRQNSEQLVRNILYLGAGLFMGIACGLQLSQLLLPRK
jgi:hypothetical protein